MRKARAAKRIRGSLFRRYYFKKSFMLCRSFLVSTDPVFVIVGMSLFLTWMDSILALALGKVTARPDEYENGCCAEVCGVMQSICLLRWKVLCCFAVRVFYCLAQCRSLRGHTARCATMLLSTAKKQRLDDDWRFSIQ
jgi:hypothetical protein